MKKEKKDIKLRLITPVDIRRFTSKGLHNIIKKMSNKNKEISLEELAKEEKYLELIKYAARKSLVNKSEKNMTKKQQNIAKKYQSDAKILKEALENTLINQKQYDREIEYLRYKVNKKIYAKDLSENIQEKPKNPRIQRVVDKLKKIGNIVGFPFIMLGKGLQKLNSEIKVKFLTARKIVKKVKEMEQVVKQTENVSREMKMAEKSKELDNEAIFMKKKELYENSSKDVRREIYNQDYEKAVKEDRKAKNVAQRKENKKDTVLEKYTSEGYSQNANGEYYNPWTDEYDPEYDPHKETTINPETKEQKGKREAKRRENLHMNAKQQEINHEKAVQNAKNETEQIEKVEGDVLTPDEVKAIYGDLEK